MGSAHDTTDDQAAALACRKEEGRAENPLDHHLGGARHIRSGSRELHPSRSSAVRRTSRRMTRSCSPVSVARLTCTSSSGTPARTPRRPMPRCSASRPRVPSRVTRRPTGSQRSSTRPVSGSRTADDRVLPRSTYRVTDRHTVPTRLPDDRRRADGRRVGIQLRRERADPVGSDRLLEANAGSYVCACDRHLPELREAGRPREHREGLRRSSEPCRVPISAKVGCPAAFRSSYRT